MNNLTDLFNSEFKNLYALEKECAEIFESVQEEIEDIDDLKFRIGNIIDTKVELNFYIWVN